MTDIKMWCVENCCTIVSNEFLHQAERAIKQAKGIEDAIAEIESKIEHGQFCIYKDDKSLAYDDAIGIIRKHTGVSE